MAPLPDPPTHPAGPPPTTPVGSLPEARDRIAVLARAPEILRVTVEGLDDAQLDTPYRSWTIRQIAHHVADSHANAYLRCKLALTERTPTVTGYLEGEWAKLPDAAAGPVEPALLLMEGVHAAWVELLGRLTWEDLQREFYHREHDEHIPLTLVMAYYPWHVEHHTAQITWLCERHGWN